LGIGVVRARGEDDGFGVRDSDSEFEYGIG